MKHLLKTILKNKKWILLGTLLLVLVFAFSPLALADTAEEASGDPFNDVAADLMKVVVIGFSFLRLLLYPLVSIIGALMDNELIIGPGMEEKLRAIWVIVRDWVNIVFVLSLVGIALYNVLGIAGDGSNYALKSILPKIVIGLVAVNFSFLAGKVLLDATSVLTTAVYALPTDLGDWDEQKTIMLQNVCDYDEDLSDGFQDSAGKRLISDGSVLAAIFCEPEAGDTGYYSGEFSDFGASYFENFGAHNVAVTLMVNMGQVTDVDLVSFSRSSTVDQFTNLTLQSLFGILMFLLFGFAFVAMVVVLAVRIVVLWICLALSPLLVLLFLFPDISSSLGGELDLKSQFFKHLFVPVVMGVVLSIGFTMLAVFQNSAGTGGWLGSLSDKHLNELDNLSDSVDGDQLFGRNITQFQDLIIAISAIIIIWVGVFSAASNTLASTWTGAIKSAGESTGKFLAETPLYATVIPVKTAAGESKIGLMNAIGAIPQMMSSVNDKRRRGTTDFANQVLGVGGEEAFNNNVRSSVQSGSKLEAQRALKERAETKGADKFDWKTLLTADALTRLGVPPDQQGKITSRSSGEIYELLQKDSKLAEQVFGVGNLPKEWGTGNLPDTNPSKTESKDDTAAKAAAEADASKARQTKIPKATAALAASPAATNLFDVKDKQDVSVALNQVGLTPTEAKDLFNDPTADGLDQAMARYANLGSDDTQSEQFLRGIDIKDGKIDAQSFIHQVGTIASATTATPATPGAGAAPASGAPSPAPGAPTSVPGGAPAVAPTPEPEPPAPIVQEPPAPEEPL